MNRLVFATLTTVTSALTFLPTALAAQASADSVARPISLDEAVKLAQQNSPTTVQAAGTTRSNAASVRTAYMAFIPTLSFNAGATKTSGNRPGQTGSLVEQNPAYQYSSGLNMNVDLLDGIIQVEPADAKEMARRAAREEGILVGISSGATLAAIAQKLAELGSGKRVLGFNYDTGERYLSVPDFLPEE